MISEAVIEAAAQRAQFNIDRMALLATIAAKAKLHLEVVRETVEYLSHFRHYDGPRLVTHFRLNGYVARPTLDKSVEVFYDVPMPAQCSLRMAEAIVTPALVQAAWRESLRHDADATIESESSGVVSTVALVDCCYHVVASGAVLDRCIHWAQYAPLSDGELADLRARIARTVEKSRAQHNGGNTAHSLYLAHLARHLRMKVSIAEARRYVVIE